MRTIKFRIWDKENNIMRYPDSYVLDPCWFGVTSEHYLDDSSACCYPMSDNGIELMQYTGLKDDAGNEVYESDIIQDEFGSKYLVVFKDGSFYGEYPGDDDLDADINIFHPDSNLEVIGNIHSNPELV